MLFQRLKKIKGSLVLSSAPTSARPADKSESLAAKYEAQVKWMREKGITGSLDGTKEQDRKPPLAVPAGLMKPENSEK